MRHSVFRLAVAITAMCIAGQASANDDWYIVSKQTPTCHPASEHDGPTPYDLHRRLQQQGYPSTIKPLHQRDGTLAAVEIVLPKHADRGALFFFPSLSACEKMRQRLTAARLLPDFSQLP